MGVPKEDVLADESQKVLVSKDDRDCQLSPVTNRLMFRIRRTAPMPKRSINPNQKDGTSLLISTQAVADLAGVSVRSIQRWVEKGHMPKPLRANGRSRWRRSVIVKWVEEGCPRRTSRPRHIRPKKLPPAATDVQVDRE